MLQQRLSTDVVRDYKARGEVVLGRTIPALLEEACDANPNRRALNQWHADRWTSVSTHGLRTQADSLALGLRELNLARGDRVAMLMHSDTFFVIADMGCLTAGLVNVPVYLTYARALIQFILNHAEARALITSDIETLHALSGFIDRLPRLETIIVATGSSEHTDRPAFLHTQQIELLSLNDVIGLGEARRTLDADAARRLKSEIDPQDLATIVYTSGTTGRPKGVMLTHENISFNVVSSFTGLDGLEKGGGDVALSFLPLTHLFARAMVYGYIYFGFSVYFSNTKDLSHHLKSIKPTTFATVPRVLEKIHEDILSAGDAVPGIRGSVARWALDLAGQFRLEERQRLPDRLKLAIAGKIVFSKWRAALGGRISFIIAGGAAVRADLIDFFAAADINIYQGYGLTETGPVISFNRSSLNRAGSVGVPITGIDVVIASNGEILTRGPHVMKGYYRCPQASKEAIDTDGWFHTGDIGEFDACGLLRITDRLKDRFKLSTGKYVTPQPLEIRLRQDRLVDDVVVVGAGYKFCSALIFPNLPNLEDYAQKHGIDPALSMKEILDHQLVADHFKKLIEASRDGLPDWSTIKRFALLPTRLADQDGLLTPTLKLRRSKIWEQFADDIEALYADG